MEQLNTLAMSLDYNELSWSTLVDLAEAGNDGVCPECHYPSPGMHISSCALAHAMEYTAGFLLRHEDFRGNSVT